MKTLEKNCMVRGQHKYIYTTHRHSDYKTDWTESVKRNSYARRYNMDSTDNSDIREVVNIVCDFYS